MMVFGFLVNIIGAAVLLLLMHSAAPGATGLKGPVGVAFVAAVFVSLIPALMYWNWWHFPVPFTAVTVIENTIGWTLAGFVMAKIALRAAPAAPPA